MKKNFYNIIKGKFLVNDDALKNWRFIFFINIPINLFSIIVSYTKMPTFVNLNYRKFDLYGYVCIAVTLACALFFCDTLSDPYIHNSYKIILPIIAIVAAILYFRHSKQSSQPLLDNKLWQTKALVRMLSASFIARIAINSLPFLIPLILQSSYNYSAVRAGAMMSCAAVGFLVARTLTIPLNKALSKRKIILTMLPISFCCFIALSSISWHLNWYVLAAILFLYGLCQSTAITTMNVFIYHQAPAELTSQVTMINSTVIQLSASFSIAIAATYLIAIVGERILQSMQIPIYAFHYIFIFEAIFIISAFILIARKPMSAAAS